MGETILGALVKGRSPEICSGLNLWMLLSTISQLVRVWGGEWVGVVIPLLPAKDSLGPTSPAEPPLIIPTMPTVGEGGMLRRS